MQQTHRSQQKVLLVLLPSWSPLMPPLGISCLKGYLAEQGCNVKAVDANLETRLTGIYYKYIEALRGYIPADRQGNFHNTGNDVWQNHMMAHLNYTDETAYKELVKVLVDRSFSCRVRDSEVEVLNEIIAGFYPVLETYFIDLLEKEKPSLLGLSVYSGTLPASLFVFRLTREKYPHIKTVMGGGIFSEPLSPGSPNLERFLEKTAGYIDKLIIGEGERLFLKYIRGELPESRRVYGIGDLNGETLDISLLGVPDFSDFSLEWYPYLGSYTSRSCLFQCSFCSETLQWGPFRKKSPGQIAAELMELHHKHGGQLFLMGDSLLNPVVSGLAQELNKAGVPLYWDGYLRADGHAGDVEKTMLWRRGGFYRARLGLESGSQRVLDLMNKKITPAQIKAAVSGLAAAGIKTTTYWVIGYPGETDGDFQQTLDLIEELKDDIYEADCNTFAYFLSGQTKSGEWAEQNKPVRLYPGTAEDMLLVQTWVLDCEPSREKIIERSNRFVRHCRKLGIPNPYLLYEIYEADKRWKRLHPNSVPSVIELMESRNKRTLFSEK